MKISLSTLYQTLRQINTRYNKNESTFLWALHPQRSHLAVSNGISVYYYTIKEIESEFEIDEELYISCVNIKTNSQITSIAWLCSTELRIPIEIKPEDQDTFFLKSYLMIGTDKGEFYIFAMNGFEVFRRHIHNGAINAIICKHKTMSIQDEGNEEISICFSDVIVTLNVLDLLSIVKTKEYHYDNINDTDVKSNLVENKFNISRKSGMRTFGINLGIQPHSLKYVLNKNKSKSKLSLLSVGRSPAIGLYEATVSEDESTLKLLGKYTIGLPSMALNSGKNAIKKSVGNWWLFKRDKEENELLMNSNDLKLRFALRDSKRTIIALNIAPIHNVAITVDTLGRIMLLDTRHALVLKIWKGYREAQCGWITRPDEKINGQLMLYLVIFAPRRECLEVWPMRYGSRIYVEKIESNISLLSTVPPFGLEGGSWLTNCLILDHDKEEIIDLESKIFQKQKIKNVWETMLAV